MPINIDHLPKHIIEKLKEKGYFELTHQEREEKNRKAWQAIYQSSKGDTKAERKALKELRTYK